MKKVLNLSIIFILIILSCVLLHYSISNRGISSVNLDIETKSVLDNEDATCKNIYVVDNYNGGDIETNIDDDNYYMIVSNKEISDEDAIKMADDLEKSKEFMIKKMNESINEMIKIQEFFNNFFTNQS